MALFTGTINQIGWGYNVLRRSSFSPEFKTLSGKIIAAVFIVALIIILEGVALWYFSAVDDEMINHPMDGIYFVVVSIFGETSSPTGIWPRLITLIALLEGLILATYLIAVSAFFTIRGGKVMTRTFREHYIVCGWNFQGPRVIEELISARGSDNFDIVVLPGEDTPADLADIESKVFVVNGSTTEDATLEAADIRFAIRAIILTDTTLPPNTADAEVLMITLAVETINPDIYTCVQLMNSENQIHLQRANVDETIPFDVLGANLSVASAINPGITRMVSELVHFNEGSEFYKVNPPLPVPIIGKSFKQASSWFAEKEMILIGVESDDLEDSYGTRNTTGHIGGDVKSRGVVVNPKDYYIDKEDALFVIADDDPKDQLSD